MSSPDHDDVERVGRLLHRMHPMSERLPWESLGAAQPYFLKRARMLLASDWLADRLRRERESVGPMRHNPRP